MGSFKNLGWVHKYFHMIFPDKIEDFHSIEYQKFYLIKMHQKPIKPDGRYALAAQFMRTSKETDIQINNFTFVLVNLFGPLHNYWRIDITNGEISYWNDMFTNGYTAIGWHSIGDLKVLDDKQAQESKEEIKRLLNKYYPDNNQNIAKKASQIFSFLDAKYRDLWELPLPREMLYQLSIYAISGLGNNSSKILYPTTNQNAKIQKIDIMKPINGEKYAEIFLKSVFLDKIADLLSQRSDRELKQYINEIVLFN